MKHSTHRHTTDLSATSAALLGLVLTICTFPAVAIGQAQEHLSHRQVKALIGTATTSSDHLRLAAYYRAEAARLRKDASDHQDEAKAYANTSAYTPKGPPGGWLEHCKKFANSFAQAADEAEALATAHQNMAEQAK